MLDTEYELKTALTKVANWPHWDSLAEDFCVVDYAGSNVDDAFYAGEVAGQVQLARLLLKRFFGETVAGEDESHEDIYGEEK